MDILFDPINFILLIAAISVFWWLRSVLGQRTGLERSTKQIEILPPISKQSLEQTQPAKIINENWQNIAEPGSDLVLGLDSIRKAEPEFNANHFLEGAKQAHEMILVAFAQGDKKALKPLLSKAVFDSFEKAIEGDRKLGNSNIFKFVSVISAKIMSAEIQNNVAAIGMKFESEIVSATLNSNKEVIAGDDKTVSIVKEHWVFEREIGKKDPNWKLAATNDSPSTTIEA
jgi:predicted lipid-binding transport protein (Tim44 family)